MISEFFSQLTSNAATNAEKITSWQPDFADSKNPLTFILSRLRKERGELTAPAFTSKIYFWGPPVWHVVHEKLENAGRYGLDGKLIDFGRKCEADGCEMLEFETPSYCRIGKSEV